jgi:hypothetical protein
MHATCGERGPLLRLWSHSPAPCDSLKATVQARETGLLSTTSYHVSRCMNLQYYTKISSPVIFGQVEFTKRRAKDFEWRPHVKQTLSTC